VASGFSRKDATGAELPPEGGSHEVVLISSRLRRGTSLWLDQYDGPRPAAPPLTARHEADVVIIGGGITGCVAAARLAARGLRVVVLEAKKIGSGSTAASTALLMQEPDVDFGDLSERYGRVTATSVWKASRRAVRSMIRTIARFRIPTALHRLPSVYFTRNRNEARALEREVRARARAGLHCRWLDSDELVDLTGIRGAGAILTRGNAQVNPYVACLGFAAAAGRRGARLYERSTVRRVNARGSYVEVETERGMVQARWAIVATGYATPEFKPLAGRFQMRHTYVIATPPLEAKQRRRIGLGDVMLWDTERPYHYARWTADHRLLLGGRDYPASRKTSAASLRKRTDELTADLIDLYPSARDLAPEYAWEGLFATTPDGLPYIGRHGRYPRHLFALGYGGNGMTFGFLAAEILDRMIRGVARPEDALFRFGRL
jgi:glycine/D-amino acid oxidase-like deaminating enzyme